MQKANASNAAFAMIFGDTELDEGFVQVKDLRSGDQFEVMMPNIPEDIVRILGEELLRRRNEK